MVQHLKQQDAGISFMMEEHTLHVLMVGCIDHTSKALLELGAVYSLLQNKREVTAYQIQTARELVLTDYEDVDLMIDYARAINERRKIDLVMSFCEYAQLAAARIAVDLGPIPTNCDLFAVENTRDKRRLRQLLSNKRLPNVSWRVVESMQQLQAFKNATGKAIIVKPIAGASSEGVHYVDADADLARAYRHAATADCGGILAEEYIDGLEYSVESMSFDGRHEITAITRKSVNGPPHFIEVGHVQPCPIEERHLDEVRGLIDSMLTALGHRHGPAHTEIKINESGVHIIESHVRAGGDQIWELTLLTTGADFVVETLRSLTGLPQSTRVPKYRHVAIRYFTLPSALGPVTRNDLKAAYTPDARVIRLKLGNDRAGTTEADQAGLDAVTPMRSSDRSGYIMIRGRTVDEAEDLAKKEVDRLLEGLLRSRN